MLNTLLNVPFDPFVFFVVNLSPQDSCDAPGDRFALFVQCALKRTVCQLIFLRSLFAQNCFRSIILSVGLTDARRGMWAPAIPPEECQCISSFYYRIFPVYIPMYEIHHNSCPSLFSSRTLARYPSAFGVDSRAGERKRSASLRTGLLRFFTFFYIAGFASRKRGK